ncbi:DUF4383 domain-containing protein [Streptomyces sp. DT73]|uniref:DUF4383 domain-containing protein n=1 Tax=Streptomyces sp. DT73 TaxID=3393420 RepID=UPI003CF6C04C
MGRSLHVCTHGPSCPPDTGSAGRPDRGAVFLLVGVLGFIPDITTNYDTMRFAAHHSEAKLLGPGVIALGVLLSRGRNATQAAG